MSDLFHIAKSIILTLVIVVILQIKVGEFTLEQSVVHWAQQSSIITPVQQVADGGLKVLRELWHNTLGKINSKFFNQIDNSNTPGHRSLGITLQRSKEFFKEEAHRAKAAVKERADKLKEISQKQIKNFKAQEGAPEESSN